MMGFSGWHLFILLIIVLIIFGPGKLPSVGKQLGSAISEFKTSIKGEEKDKPATTEETDTEKKD